MKTADLNTALIDSYYNLLKNLSPDNKLELIARLARSMQTTSNRENEIPLESLYGSWQSEQTSDELIDELKSVRNFTRSREEL